MKTFGGNNYESGNSAMQTPDGGYIIIGSTKNADFWLIKTDSYGEEIWRKTYGGSYGDFARSVQQRNDGGYIITGDYTPRFFKKYDLWLIKTDGNGDALNIPSKNII